MSARPKVSVLIPCHDLGRFLDEAVESVLRQTRQDFEILVVNDGSTDAATNALLASYERPRTRVLSTENRGLARARNLALEHAAGEYVCALDADDLLEPRFLEQTVGALEQDPSLTFASCWLRTFGDEDWEWRQDRCDLAAVLAEDTVLTAAPVRRQAVLAAGGYDPGMPAPGYEDWDLWITLLERGARGAIVPEVLFRYRRRPGSMSEQYRCAEIHLGLWGYLVAKHRASYERHLFEVLERREADAAELLRGNYELEREIATLLDPQIAGARAEAERLQAKLAAAPGRAGREHDEAPAAAERTAELERQLAAARFEAAALRASLSWRVTAPLRAIYGWMRHEPR
jgi:glycosyltransferase involved in cell wall biosynthesis